MTWRLCWRLTMAPDVPLSSASLVPLTEETRQRLIRHGVAADVIAELTEMGGLALLDLSDEELGNAPVCFGAYDRANRLCDGCVFKPHCKGQRRPMRPSKKKSGRPVRPSKKEKKTPPPRPGKKRAPPDRRVELAAGMKLLGYTDRQIQLAQPAVRARIVDEQIRNEGVSISKGGQLRFVGGDRGVD